MPLVTIHWNENLEPDIAYYNLYAGHAGSGVYTAAGSPQNVGNNIEATWNVDVGGTWYWAVTAVNTSNAESPFSTEISAVFDFAPPPIGGILMDALSAMACF